MYFADKERTTYCPVDASSARITAVGISNGRAQSENASVTFGFDVQSNALEEVREGCAAHRPPTLSRGRDFWSEAVTSLDPPVSPKPDCSTFFLLVDVDVFSLLLPCSAVVLSSLCL